MDGKVVIKEEPLDIETEMVFDSENPVYGTLFGTESIKTENPIFLCEQTLSVGDYSKLEENTQHVEPLLHYKFDASQPLPHKCQKNCGRKFTTLEERLSHESNEHKDIPRTRKCNICNKTFPSFFALTRHMSEHRDVKKYICTYCSECYSSYQDLQIHWKTSINCYRENMESTQSTRNNDIVLEEPHNQSTETTLPNNLIYMQPELIFPHQQQTNSLDLELPSLNNHSYLPLLPPQLPSIKSQTKSFAEEIKAFTAKYQLKTSVVAKKRTSPVIVKPIESKSSKKRSKKSKNNFEIVSHYAIPKAIGTCNAASDIQIKEEPIDLYEEHSNFAHSVLDTDIQIKSEPLDDYVKVKNEPFDVADNNFDTNPNAVEITENIFTTDSAEPSNQTNESTLPNESFSTENSKIIKISNIQTKILENDNSPHVAIKLDSKLDSTNIMPNKNIKIIKLASNTKIVKLPSVKVEPFKSVNEHNPISTQSKPPNISLNRNSPSLPEFVPIKLPYSGPLFVNAENESVKQNVEPPVANEMNGEKSLVKLLEESIKNGENKKRINCVPKQVLSFIESQPQKMKIIEDIQRQIEIAGGISTYPLSVEELRNSKLSTVDQVTVKQEPCKDSQLNTSSELQPPSSFYFPINQTHHPDLNNARRIYHNYRFSWICPQCHKFYDQRHAFLGHLISAHSMSHEELENLIVEVRPIRMEDTKLVKKKQDLLNKIQKFCFNQMAQEHEMHFSSDSQLRCPKCHRFCSSRRMLNDHIAGDCSRKPLYPCPSCQKSFYSQQTLNCHITIHTGELPHKCNFCDKRFRTRGQVTVHHRTHTGEKPFACQICSQRFTHRETLISHLSRHIGMKRYRCYGCGEHFSCISGLKAHHELRPSTCGKVKLNTRAVGPRVRVVRGQVHFEPQPEINAYLRTEDPPIILSEIQNIQKANSEK